MAITRRVFIRNSGLAVVGTAAVPSFLTRAAFGAPDPGRRSKRLVIIFQRGAADGLNIVVPHSEPAYYAMRPSINIPRTSVLDLDGMFGLHPALAPLMPLWKQRHLAMVHAAGSPDPSLSLTRGGEMFATRGVHRPNSTQRGSAFNNADTQSVRLAN